MKRSCTLLFILVLVTATTSLAGPISIDFSGGFGGNATLYTNGSMTLAGAPLDTIYFDGSAYPFAGEFNLILPTPTGTVDISGTTFLSYTGAAMSITSSGQTLLFGVFSQAYMAGFPFGQGAGTYFIGVLDPSQSAFGSVLNPLNPLQSGFAGSVALYFDLTSVPDGYAGNAYQSNIHTVGSVPEPASIILLGSGLMVVMRRRLLRTR